ncbi:MAG TPA: choice-of-anchor B family protein [Bacteroidota bacterium]|nr:choice-of-anchor B family protein [Bacteroidota bacterium]
MRNVYRVLWQVLPLTLFIVSSAFTQNGVSRIDTLNARHGGPGGSYGFYFASCWGYVAPDGHEYALLGAHSGTSIIDLDVVPIREVAYIPGVNSEWKEIKTWGHCAYVVSEGNQGVQIINLSQLPDTAWLLRSITSIGGKNVTRNHTVTVADGYLYLNGSANATPGGTIILSLADPENPTYVGSYAPVYFHDTYVRNDTLYGAALSGGIYIASLANKAAPQTITQVTYTGSGTHNVWATKNARYMLTSDEVGTTAKNMKVWDLQNLPTVTQQVPFTFSPTTVIHNVHVRGDYVYVAHYKSGVFVGDVHNPLAIASAGTFNTYTGGGTSASYAGAWGVYPYFPSGKWIASDTQTGLHVFTFTGLAPRTRSPLLLPLDGDSLDFGSPEMFQWRSAAVQADDPHYYQVHIWGPGVDTLLRARDSSLAVTSLSGLQIGQSYHWHVWIRDEFTSVSSQDTSQFVCTGPISDVTTDLGTPAEFQLVQNYPNPFNPNTVIRYQLPTSSRVVLKVYNLIGKEVATLVDDTKPAGSHDVQFDAQSLSSGVYFYTLRAGGLQATRKMVLMK